MAPYALQNTALQARRNTSTLLLFGVQGILTSPMLEVLPISTFLLGLFPLLVLSIPMVVTGKLRYGSTVKDWEHQQARKGTWVSDEGIWWSDLVHVTEAPVAKTAIRAGLLSWFEKLTTWHLSLPSGERGKERGKKNNWDRKNWFTKRNARKYRIIKSNKSKQTKNKSRGERISPSLYQQALYSLPLRKEKRALPQSPRIGNHEMQHIPVHLPLGEWELMRNQETQLHSALRLCIQQPVVGCHDLEYWYQDTYELGRAFSVQHWKLLMVSCSSLTTLK